MSGSFGIDPTLDIAGAIGTECFSCGKPILSDPLFFGPVGLPQLPVHRLCVSEATYPDPKTGGPGFLPVFVLEYERRIHDLANVKRTR